VAVGNRGQSGIEVGEGLDSVDLVGFDPGSDAALGDAAFVVAQEEACAADRGCGAQTCVGCGGLVGGSTSAMSVIGMLFQAEVAMGLSAAQSLT
jgi:hypothetical protein